MNSITSLCRDSMFWTPERQAPSAWTEHVPFAFWLIDALRPETIVELGTQRGVSYSAMCQAVKTLGLLTRCFAIDTWKGDEHAGFYSEDIYSEFSHFHDLHYGSFSRLVRSTFDEAHAYFEDGSIDLLHIDGLHTYEAVHHDFSFWKEKLKPNAVVLFHDTNVRELGFGVFKFWKEVAFKRPHFNFLHGHGLGVLGLGQSYSIELQSLFGATDNEKFANAIRAVFARLGHSIELSNQVVDLSRQLLEREKDLVAMTEELAKHNASATGLEKTAAVRAEELAKLREATAEQDAKIAALEHTALVRAKKIAVLNDELADADAQRIALERMISDLGDELISLKGMLGESKQEIEDSFTR